MIHKTVASARIPHESNKLDKTAIRRRGKAQIELGTVQTVATHDISPCSVKVSYLSTFYHQHQRPEPEHSNKSNQTLMHCSSTNLRSSANVMHTKLQLCMVNAVIYLASLSEQTSFAADPWSLSSHCMEEHSLTVCSATSNVSSANVMHTKQDIDNGYLPICLVSHSSQSSLAADPAKIGSHTRNLEVESRGAVRSLVEARTCKNS